jgi:hypothetical protein
LAPQSRVTVEINGIRNPRSLKPTGTLYIASYLSSLVAPIDVIKSDHDSSILKVTMTTPLLLTVTSINPVSFFVGKATSYIVSLKADTPIYPEDVLVINFSEIKILSTPLLACTGV